MNFKKKAGTGNDIATGFGFVEAVEMARRAEGTSLPSMPGAASTVANHAGGVLAALGLGRDLQDMYTEGLTGDNVSSASGNMAGVLSAVPLGTPTTQALAASYSGGNMVGSYGNNYMKEKGDLGPTNTEYEAPGNRGWDDMAADWGRSTRDVVGDGLDGLLGETVGHGAGWVAGAGATLAGSVVGGVGAAGDAVIGAGKWLAGERHPLLEGVGAQVAAANDNANGGRSK